MFSDFYDKLSPVSVNLTWNLVEESSTRVRRSFSSLLPILNSVNTEGKQIHIRVRNRCGASGICRSALKAVGKFQTGITGKDRQYQWTDLKPVSVQFCQILKVHVAKFH